MNPEDFFHSTGTTVYTDYDPATRTVKVSRGGVMGMSDAGRMSVDRLMDETDIGGTSDDGLSIRRGNYDPEFAQAFQQFEAAQPTFPQPMPTPPVATPPVATQPSPDATQPPVQSFPDVRMSRMPYAASVVRDDTSMDPILQQLLYGTGGIGGFVPGAMRAAERTFFDAEGRPIVIPELAAEFTPDQLVAQQLARQQV